MPENALDEARQLLERALCLEVDGEAFYRQAAAATSDPGGRRMFLELAAQEADHQAIIRRQAESLEASGRWAADERLLGAECDLSQSLFPQGAARAKGGGPRANELEALWLALEKESESYELYRQGALEATDATAKALCRYLMAAERGHFEVLMASYEAIVNEQYRGK